MCIRDRAIGVEYFKNGQLQKMFARKEVILSAGTIQSPQLLLLSGIGPREDLEKLGKFWNNAQSRLKQNPDII